MTIYASPLFITFLFTTIEFIRGVANGLGIL
jgi:hypothetical protein